MESTQDCRISMTCIQTLLQAKLSGSTPMGVKASNADTPTLREIHKLSPAEINVWYDSMDVEIAALRAKNTMIERLINLMFRLISKLLSPLGLSGENKDPMETYTSSSLALLFARTSRS
jgi:hypothetical protein